MSRQTYFCPLNTLELGSKMLEHIARNVMKEKVNLEDLSRGKSCERNWSDENTLISCLEWCYELDYVLQNSYVGVRTPNVTIPGDRVLREVIKVK